MAFIDPKKKKKCRNNQTFNKNAKILKIKDTKYRKLVKIHEKQCQR